MRIKISRNSRGEIRTPLGTYHRALENCNNIFYVNFEETDENASVKMYDRKRNLISENIFAYSELTRVLEAEEYSWISEDLKKIW
jgi:hypothetical protein